MVFSFLLKRKERSVKAHSLKSSHSDSALHRMFRATTVKADRGKPRVQMAGTDFRAGNLYGAVTRMAALA